jgi:MATE family multidrug resistance protein
LDDGHLNRSQEEEPSDPSAEPGAIGHFAGPGGITILLQIAFPMMVSHAAETLMLFIDRLFLSRLGDAYLSASMIGGITCFLTTTFFFGVIGYVNALSAQHYGAGNRSRCALATTQGLILALAAYPVILALRPLGVFLMESSGHSPLQTELETDYFRILVWGTIFALSRMALSGFFSGIGRTRIVMVANLIAMLVNIVFNWLLIFGKCGFPELRIAGAAYGTIIGSAVGTLILFIAYFSSENRRVFATWRELRFHAATMRILWRFGFPSGLEFLLNMLAFTLFIQLFHSYGPLYAAAMTITFNWDLVAFIPMLGINVATTSLVGRYMGAGLPETAVRSAYSGFKITLLYAGTIMALFVVIPETLVSVFVHDVVVSDSVALIATSKLMLRMAALYTLADATALVFSAAIRGAGDTRWALKTSVAIHWMVTIVAVTMIRVLHSNPIAVWSVFVIGIFLMAIAFFHRFRSGKWKEIRVIA